RGLPAPPRRGGRRSRALPMTERSLLRTTVLLASLALTGTSPADEPTLTNRPPAPNEWGYRPDDGSVVALNPPSLTWVLEPDAASYTVQWASTPDFRDATTIEGVPWPTYTHHAPLAPGDYAWRY